MVLTVAPPEIRVWSCLPDLQEGTLPVLPWTPHLRLCEKDGSFLNEYRISAGRVEVRALDSNGEPYPGYSEWVSITPEEIRLHFVNHTPVAQWLKEVLKPGRESTRVAQTG